MIPTRALPLFALTGLLLPMSHAAAAPFWIWAPGKVNNAPVFFRYSFD